MNPILHQMVNQKVNSLSKQDLLNLAKQHQVPLTDSQAEKVISIIRSEKVDVANKAQVNTIIQRLQTEVDSHISSVIQSLLQEFGHYLK